MGKKGEFAEVNIRSGVSIRTPPEVQTRQRGASLIVPPFPRGSSFLTGLFVSQTRFRAASYVLQVFLKAADQNMRERARGRFFRASIRWESYSQLIACTSCVCLYA